jgi:hypothetical protein
VRVQHSEAQLCIWTRYKKLLGNIVQKYSSDARAPLENDTLVLRTLHVDVVLYGEQAHKFSAIEVMARANEALTLI